MVQKGPKAQEDQRDPEEQRDHRVILDLLAHEGHQDPLVYRVQPDLQAQGQGSVSIYGFNQTPITATCLRKFLIQEISILRKILWFVLHLLLSAACVF